MLGEPSANGHPVSMLTRSESGAGATDPLTAEAIAAGIRSGSLDPLDVVEGCLARIEESDPSIGAFSCVGSDRARAEAEALRRDADRLSGALAGVPVAIKDVFDVAGLPTRLGSSAAQAAPATADSQVVRRLRAAGAVIVGKTTLPELGVWATTDGPGGVTRSPRAPRRTAGGSSGGSAAAVAAGMVPLAIGTDALGSIRIPAAACGVVGFKPGEGVVPGRIRGGDWHGMAETGPLATTVADAALATAILAGRRGLASADVDRPLLVALSARSPLPGGAVDQEWVAAAQDVAGALQRAGHRVVEDHPPYSALYALPVFARWLGGVAHAADSLGEELERAELQRRTRTHIRLGGLVHAVGGPRDGLKHRWRQGVRSFFAGYDALLTPAIAHPLLPARRWSRRSWLRNVRSNVRFAPFSALWNLAGTPAGAVPIGTRSDGSPLAVQVVAEPGGDERALALMRAIERVVSR